jgi:hypothetical protein
MIFIVPLFYGFTHLSSLQFFCQAGKDHTQITFSVIPILNQSDYSNYSV